MRQLIIFPCCFFFFIHASHAQNKTSWYFGAGTFTNYSFSKIYMITDGTTDSNESCVSVRPFYSFRLNSGIIYNLSQKIRLTTGLSYLYRYIDINIFPYNIPFIYTGTRLHVLQLPVSTDISLVKTQHELNGGFSVGFNFSYYQAEIQEFGKWQNTIVMTKLIRDGFFYTLLYSHVSPELTGALFLRIPFRNNVSVNGRLYFSWPLTKNLGHELFYYKRIDTSVISDREFRYYERDSRLGFNLEIENFTRLFRNEK